jgi:hypothetical protein
MEQLPYSITLVIAALTVFLCFVVGIKYAIEDNFTRTRLIMTSFFFFIVTTLSISFWEYAYASLPYTVPASLIGAGVGYLFGVRAAQERLQRSGVEHYVEHFAHVHITDLASLTWWSVINFYTVMGGLILINLVGLSTVIFKGDEVSAIRTSMVGAFLLGTIVPYLFHLWSIKAPHHTKSTAREA